MRKITSLLTLLLLFVAGTVGASADVITATPANGTYLTSSGNYVNSITFATTPALTVTASANNMDKRQTGSYLLWHSGTAASGSTYTLSVPIGYRITEYSITGEANTAVQTLTAGSTSHEFAVGTSSTFTVTGLSATSTSFLQTGANASGLKITKISVTIEDDPVAAIMGQVNTNVASNTFTLQTLYGVTGSDKVYTESSDASEGNVPAMLDNATGTFHHSDWHGAATTPHWVTYELPDVTEAIRLYIYRRANGTGQPYNVTISGSNDNTTFTEVTTANLAWSTSYPDLYSQSFSSAESYKYWRVTVNSSYHSANLANLTANSWFCAAEFYVLPNNSNVNTLFDAENQYRAGNVTDEATAQTLLDNVNAAITDMNSTTVTVTYELYESDGTTLVSSEDVVQPKNSAVSIPTSMTSNAYYTYATEGTIGTSDCTIKVTRTLADASIVADLANLSNNKAYYITTRNNARGSLAISNNYLASSGKAALGVSPEKFAILSYEGRYYLYSVTNSKFVTYSESQKAPLAAVVTGTSDAVSFTTTTKPLFLPKFNDSSSLVLNSSSDYTYGIVINGWGASSSQWDDGCQYTIHEVENFDPTAALAALEEFFHPSNYYSYVESEVLPWLMDNSGNPAETIGKPFGLTTEAASSIVTTYLTQLNNQQFSQAEYEGIVAAKNAGIKYPETGNYRFKNTNRGRTSYIAYGTAIVAWNSENRGNGLVTIDESDIKADASTVFTLIKTADNNYKISTEGLFVKAPSENNFPFRLDEESAAVTYKFTPLSPGIVAIGPADVTDSEAQRYFHEGDAGTWGNVHCVVQWKASSDASKWSVEEADEITVAMHTADDNKAYATFYAPFDATFTGGVTAYTITRGAAIDGVGSEAVMTAVSGAVPAGTPVVLVDETGTVAAATANVSYGAAALGVENILSGHYLASTVADGSLVFGQANSTPGFYRYDDYKTVLGANRAFIAPAQANNVRAIVFTGGVATGINAATFNANGNAYDLQGRRVQNAQKGLYILNGKKVLVK